MDRLVYTSLSALRGAMARQASTANNIANVNTVGFRGEYAAASALYVRGDGEPARAHSSEQVVGADLRSGTVNMTGRELDVAMDGDALLTVQAPNGDEAYTRRGDLSVAETGLLTNGEGYPVIGEEGPITVPPYDKINIEQDGLVRIVPMGGNPEQPQIIGRLKLASPAGSQIVKGTDGLFRVKDGGVLPADPEGKLLPGGLEGSNVEASRALAEMIEASRSWDTQIKLITTARELDSSAAELMRLPS
jgi:flagellar basal-body rod protein FlgF